MIPGFLGGLVIFALFLSMLSAPPKVGR